MTQALIVIGAGHGIAPLILFEAVGIVKPLRGSLFVDQLAPAIFLFSLMTFVGQLLTVYSIYSKNALLRKMAQIIGLFLLFIGTLYICSVIYFDPYTVVLYVTGLPFVICVLLTMFGRSIGNLFRRAH